ncbi:MAG TPA: SRPBCC family protein [Nocardioides sp.]|nr:SRPBCC family protein [Nocardioides sp.]
MELTHRFSVPASKEVTWAAFNDIESVAGCFPGAVVTGVEGDDFTGTCKVKLGPIALTYAGSGTFIEKDEGAGRFVLEAKGKDKRGNGTAGATVTATITEAGPDRADVEVLTDLSITGKPAQFGRGVIQDVSDKLLGQFMDCLEQRLGPGGGAEAPDEAPAPGSSEPTPSPAATDTPLAAASEAALASSGDEAGGVTAAGAAGSAAGASAHGRATAGTWRRPETGGEPDDALDLGATVLPILLKTYWRQLAGAVLVVLLLRRLLGGRKG